MKRLKEGLKILLVATIVLIIVSATFYINVEGWNAVDAIYFTIITITTVGYGDLFPTTNVSKLVTALISFIGIAMMLTMFGIVSAGYARIISEHEQKREAQSKIEQVKQEEKIEELKKKVKSIKKIIK